MLASPPQGFWVFLRCRYGSCGLGGLNFFCFSIAKRYVYMILLLTLRSLLYTSVVNYDLAIQRMRL
jgi:hypothetical protein